MCAVLTLICSYMSKCPINPITNGNFFSSHTQTRDNDLLITEFCIMTLRSLIGWYINYGGHKLPPDDGGIIFFGNTVTLLVDYTVP
jgi:hypothetical protein